MGIENKDGEVPAEEKMQAAADNEMKPDVSAPADPAAEQVESSTGSEAAPDNTGADSHATDAEEPFADMAASGAGMAMAGAAETAAPVADTKGRSKKSGRKGRNSAADEGMPNRKAKNSAADEGMPNADGTVSTHAKKRHRKRNLIILAALLLVLAIVGTTLGVMFTGSPDPIVDLGFETVKYEIPSDGSKPTEHTGVENIGYMNYKLRSQPYYYAEMHGTVDTIMTQQITTYKQFYNNVLISSDITTSSMINSAFQFCTTDDRVIWRESAGGKSTFDGLNTVYKTGTPYGSCTISEYKVLRGLPPSDFSVYVLNEDTIDDWSEVTDNGDGTYTQTFYLHVANEPYENSAVYYYKQQMVATGGLTDFPTFTSAQITYTFDDEWQVLEADVSEAYKATMGVTVDCTSDSVTKYTYGDEELCKNSAYDDYFSQYEDVDITPDDGEVTVTDCLAQAFGTVLTDPVVFSLDMSIDSQPMTGLLYLDINTMDIRADLGNIKLYIEEPDDGSMWLYLSYGDDTRVKLDINSLDLSAFSSSSEDGDSSGGLSLDTDQLLADLSGGEFNVSSDGSKATLHSVLDLLGLTIPVDFSFNIDSSGAITLDYVSTSLDLLGMNLDISIKFSSKSVPALTSAEKDEYMDIDDNTDSLINLIATITSTETEFELEYDSDTFSLSALVQLDLANSLAHGEIWVDFGNGTTKKYIGVDYKNGNLYITLDSEDMDALKVKANLDEAIDLISSFLSSGTDDSGIATVSADAAEEASSSIADIISSFANISLGDVVYKLLADNTFANTFHITTDGKFEIDATELLDCLGVDLNLGTLYLVADEDGVFLEDGPFDFSLTQGGAFEVDETYYVNAEDLVTLFEELETLIENKSVGLTGTVDVIAGEREEATTIEVKISNLTVDWSDGVTVYLDLGFYLNGEYQDIYVLYTGSTNTLQLAYGQVGLKLAFDTGEGSDMEKLESALVAAYDKIAEIANYYLAEEKQWDADAQTLQDILEGFGVAIEATEDSTDLISELLDLFSGTDTDNLDIMSLLGEMSFGQGKTGGFEVKIGGLDLEITDVSKNHNDEFTMDINLSYKGDSFEVDLEGWEVSAGSIGTIPDDVQYVTAEDIATLIDSLTATADILTGTTKIYITYETESMAITGEIIFSLQDSNASGTITAVFYDDATTTKTVEFGYEDGTFYLSLYSYGEEPFLVKANLSDTITVITGFFPSSEDPVEDEETTDIISTLLSTVSSLVSGETFSSVITKVFGEGQFFDIFSTDSSTGTLKIDIAAICALFDAETNLGKADFSIGEAGIILDLDEAYGVSMSITGTQDNVSIATGDYADAEDLVTLLENIEPILDDMAVSLTGSIELNISGTAVYLYIYDSKIDWADGISVYVYAALGIGDTYQDIYINYTGSTQTLQFAYGDVGASLSFASGSEDVATLEEALVDVYNRIVEIINSLVESASIKTAESLNDILSLFGTGSDLTELLGELFSSDDMSMSTDDIISMISSATFGVGDNGSLAIGIGDYLTLEILDASTTQDGLVLVVNLSYSSETFSITLDGITLKAATGTYEMPAGVSYLTADDFASMLDFVAAGLEVIGEKEMTMTISGSQYSYTSEYASYFYEKYNYTGTLAIDWGDSTYPITTDESGTIYVDPDLYMYIGLEFNANSSSDTSYTMSLYILDRDMSGEQDGLLDLYLSISNKKSTDKDYDPLMIYIPSKDVMSIISIAGALFDLDSLTSDNSTIQSILTAVAEFVDSALIDTYIPDTQDQFRSLGTSLISQFIDGGLQGLIDSLVNSVNDVVENITGGSEIDAAEQERNSSEAYIKSIDVSDTEFKLTVNSEAVYGEQAKDEDLVFKATKDADGNFTGMSIDNVYYNDMKDMLTMEMKIDRSVTRNTSFSGYTDFSGLDTLIETIVNSATHETTDTDESSYEATAEDYEEAVKKYALNSNYFISGSLSLSALSIENAEVTVDGLSINIDENNKLSLDAQISYEKDKLLGISVGIVISKTATVNISVRNDMIYMRKTVSGSSEYRIMSSSAFSADMMDQIVWILSLSSTVQSLMSGDSDSSSTDMSGYDYGALIDAYLTSYTYTASETKAEWDIVINGDTIGDLAGGLSLSDITVTLNASKNEEDSAYVLTGLSLSTKLYSVVSISATLTYDNPQNSESLADKIETLYDVEIYEGQTWDDILGGTTFDEITENINWDRILSDLGTTYLDYTGSDDLRIGQVNYYFEDENGTSTYLDGGYYVLYNASTQTIYSTLTYPDISGYDQTDKDLKAVWTDYSYNTDSNIITITATRQNTYTVTVTGVDVNESTSTAVYEHVYYSINLEKDTLAYNGNNGYYYRLKYYTDENGDQITETGIDDDGNECYVLYVNADRAVTAHWERVYEVKFYCEDGSLISEYYYSGTTLTADNMPAVPDKTGYTGTWNTKADGTGLSSYDVSTSSAGNLDFHAVYTINIYTIIFTSDLEIATSDHTYELNDDTGLYEYSVSLEYGTTFTLENVTLVSQYATVSGWTYGGATLAAGSTVTVKEDMTFSVAYSYKTITVHYFVEDAENESAKATIGIDGNYDLAVPTVSGYVIYGLYYDNDGVWTEITNVGEFVLAGETSLNVYALASTEIGMEVTGTSKSGWLSYTYKATVTATDIEFVGMFADGTYEVTSVLIGYYVNNDANLDGRDNAVKEHTYTSFTESDSLSNSSSKDRDYLVVVYSISFTYTTAEGSISISTSTETAQAFYVS